MKHFDCVNFLDFQGTTPIIIIDTITLERGTNSLSSLTSLSKVVNNQENERDSPNSLLLVIWSITR